MRAHRYRAVSVVNLDRTSKLELLALLRSLDRSHFLALALT